MNVVPNGWQNDDGLFCKWPKKVKVSDIKSVTRPEVDSNAHRVVCLVMHVR